MRVRQNLHTHTVFDDGKNTHDEMAQAALCAGLSSLGFSYHSVLPYENDWATQPENVAPYHEALSKVKKRFKDTLRIYSGIEWDGSSDPAGREVYDYVIGSFHHIEKDGAWLDIEESLPITEKILKEDYGGNAARMSEDFFAQYERFAADPLIDIIGHFDIIAKYCEQSGLIDLEAPYYLGPAIEAMGPLIRADKIFEVNTGQIYRGRMKNPCPSPLLLKELMARGARMTVSSDAHFTGQVAFGLDDAAELLKSIGFTEIWQLTDDGFAPVLL